MKEGWTWECKTRFVRLPILQGVKYLICSNIQGCRLARFAIIFSISDAAVSRHLSVLKDADLIRNEREGKFIYYELNASVLEEIILWISELKRRR